MTFQALVLRQPSHVVNSVDKTKPSDYVIVCVRVPPSRVPPPLSFLFVFDLDSSKALTNSIVPCPTDILIEEEMKFDYNHS